MKILTLAILLILPFTTFAQDLSYYLAAPIPGGPTGDKGEQKVTDLADYISYLFPFLLSVIAILALAMFVIGGIEYMLSGGIEKTKDAKDRITSALLGLALAVFSVLILQVINPNLVKINLDIAQNQGTPELQGSSPGTGPTPLPPPGPEPQGCDDSRCAEVGGYCGPCDDESCSSSSQSGWGCRVIDRGECATGQACRDCSADEAIFCARQGKNKCKMVRPPLEAEYYGPLCDR